MTRIANILATLNPRATFMYVYAIGDVEARVGYQSTEDLRGIVTRVHGMHPTLSAETLANGVKFTAGEHVWLFTLA